MWLNRWAIQSLKAAVDDKRWLVVFVLAILVAILIVAWFIISLLFQEWTQGLLHERGPGMMHDSLLFLSSETFRTLLFGSLPALFVWLYMRRAALPILGGMTGTAVFRSATIRTEPYPIDISALGHTEPFISFNILFESTQWPIEIATVSGVIFSNGRRFTSQLQVLGLPLGFPDTSGRRVMTIQQSISQERATELRAALLADNKMVSFDLNQVKIAGFARLSGGRRDFEATLYGLMFEIKTPMRWTPKFGQVAKRESRS
jgi:hypothetical protein